MECKTDKGTERKTDMVVLTTGAAELTALDAGELLERTMILLDAPGAIGATVLGQGRDAGGLMFHVTVCGDQREQAHLTVAR